jgi:hypothetical protein
VGGGTAQRGTKLREVYKEWSRKYLNLGRVNAAGNYRKLPNQEYHDLCFSAHSVRVMKSMRIRGVTYVTCTAENRIACGGLVGKPETNTSLET